MNRASGYFVSVTLFGLLILTPVLGIDSSCENVAGTGHTVATGPATFQGFAIVNINGSTRSASVTTSLLGPPKETEDGTLLAATSHNFVFDDGSSITTIDTTVLSPTDTPGLYNLNSRAAINEGSGSYELACGSLSIHGTINFANGEVIWRFTGKICDCR